jgi:uncharacterized protein (DUF2336 family)
VTIHHDSRQRPFDGMVQLTGQLLARTLTADDGEADDDFLVLGLKSQPPHRVERDGRGAKVSTAQRLYNDCGDPRRANP